MRRIAWVLLLGTVIGCGSNPIPTKVVEVPQPTEPKQVVVPVEVEALFAAGELAKAADMLTNMIAATPQDDTLYSLRATAVQRLGRPIDAIADLDRAIQLNPQDASHYNNRGFVRMGIEQFDTAMVDFDNATKLQPRYKNAYNNRGLLEIARGNYQRAIVEFNQALEIDNSYIDAYNNRGFAEFEGGQIEKALDDFNVAIQLDPNYVNAYNNRGLLKARAGDFENALNDFTLAMMIEPLNPKYYEHRRDVYKKLGAFDKAIQDEKKIVWLIQFHQLTAEIARSVQPAAKLSERARHYLRVENLDSALDDLNRAIELNPQSVDALVTRANIHLQQKAMSHAKSDAEAVLQISQNDEAYSVLGDVYLHQGDYDKAIENFARARRIDRNVAEAYYARSKEFAKKGQEDLAKSNLDQALALDPDVESRLR